MKKNNIYRIILGMGGSGSQALITDRLKAEHCEIMQVSNGLLVRSALERAEFLALVSSVDSAPSVESVDAETLSRQSDTAPDILNFLEH